MPCFLSGIGVFKSSHPASPLVYNLFKNSIRSAVSPPMIAILIVHCSRSNARVPHVRIFPGESRGVVNNPVMLRCTVRICRHRNIGAKSKKKK